MFTSTSKQGVNSNSRPAGKSAEKAAQRAHKTAKNSGIFSAAFSVRDDLEAFANNVGRQVRSIVDSAEENLLEAGETVTAPIKQYPVGASLIALSAGVVIGMFLRRLR